MDKANSLSIPVVIRSMNVEKNPFCPHENDEEILDPEVSYLSAIGALYFLLICIRSDIAFVLIY